MITLILYNGVVLPLENEMEQYEAIYVENGTIKRLGTNKDILKLKKDDSEMIDMQGSCLIPSFIAAYVTLPSDETLQNEFLNTQNKYASYGITTILEANTTKETYHLLTDASKQYELKLDVVSYVTDQMAKELLAGHYSPDTSYYNHYRIGGLIAHLDEATLKTEKKTIFYHRCLYYLKRYWQMNIHCNCQEACEQFLAIYEKAKKTVPVSIGLRPNIMHTPYLRKELLRKMKKNGIQPTFCLDEDLLLDASHEDYVCWQRRSCHTNPVKTAQELGLSFGFYHDTLSDMPNILYSVHNMVNGLSYSGKKTSVHQVLTPFEALRAVTFNAAYQIFEEELKGTLKPGKLADFTLLSANPLTCKQEEIKDIKVLATFKEGTKIFPNKTE